MNCGTYTECKNKKWVFENFGFLKNPKQSKTKSFVRKRFGFLGVFVKETVIFNIGFGFVVLESIW